MPYNLAIFSFGSFLLGTLSCFVNLESIRVCVSLCVFSPILALKENRITTNWKLKWLHLIQLHIGLRLSSMHSHYLNTIVPAGSALLADVLHEDLDSDMNILIDASEQTYEWVTLWGYVTYSPRTLWPIQGGLKWVPLKIGLRTRILNHKMTLI